MLTPSPIRLKQDSTWPTSPRSSIGCVQNNFWAKVHCHKPCNYFTSMLALSPNKLKRLPLEPRHIREPSGASKTITEPMVRLAKTVHLSCTDTNTVSKQTEIRFDMTHATYGFHRVRPKWFLSLWYVQHQPCIYLVLRLALSPNGPKCASTFATSPRSSIGFIQNDFQAYGMFGTNRGPNLQRH
jgi:hypothetical protein